MKDEDPQAPEPEPSNGGETTPGEFAGERNQWDFEAPDPMLSFHGDIPTDPGALQDRPTGPSVPPPPTQAAGPAGTGTTPPSATDPGAIDPAATRVAASAPPLASGTTASETSTRRIGTRTAAMLVGTAALIGLVVVAGLALAGGDDDAVVATNTTSEGEDTGTDDDPDDIDDTDTDDGSGDTDTDPDDSGTGTGTDDDPDEPDTDDGPGEVATTVLQDTTTWGATVRESWRLADDVLTVAVELTADDADVAGTYALVIPPAVTTDLAGVAFDPADPELLETEPVAAYELAVSVGTPVTLGWSTTVERSADETAEATLARFIAERDTARDSFLAGPGPALRITSPMRGERIPTAERWFAEGVTDPGATVTVDGADVTVGSDGSWTGGVVRESRRQTIVVIATDRFGRTSRAQVRVQFVDPPPTPTPTPIPTPTPSFTGGGGSGGGGGGGGGGTPDPPDPVPDDDCPLDSDGCR